MWRRVRVKELWSLNEREIDLEIFYVSIPFETNVSLFNCSTFLLRNVVSFPSYHRYIAAVIGTGVAMDIVSRSREVCSRIDLLQSLPFSDNCVNHFFFQPPPLLLLPFTTEEKFNLPCLVDRIELQTIYPPLLLLLLWASFFKILS